MKGWLGGAHRRPKTHIHRYYHAIFIDSRRSRLERDIAAYTHLFQRTTLHAVIFHHVLCKIALRSCLFANGCECSGLPLTILCVMCAAHNQQPVSIIKCVRSEDATHSGVGTTTLWGKAIQQQQKMWEDKLYTKGYVRRKDDMMLLVLECWSMSVSVPFAIRHIAIVQQY